MSSVAGKSCHVCSRSTGVTRTQVLDDKLGVMQEVVLCVRHRPLAFQEASVYNLYSLRKAIIYKLNQYRVSSLPVTTLEV